MQNWKRELARLNRGADNMNIKSRLEKLEAYADEDAQAAVNVAIMKPSEILACCDELIADGTQPTADEHARIESLRQVTK